MSDLMVIGGGLAGCEAAWQAAQRGTKVVLYEMRPEKMTPAHQTGYLAELVCSNSLGSKLTDRATGLLQKEAELLGSLLISCAVETSVPAGGALAVDRNAFASAVSEKISQHPNIEIRHKEVTDLPDIPTIIATGPLTSPAFSNSLFSRLGQTRLFFYDAIAPIVEADSIDMNIAFRASRYDRGEQDRGDYINCPFSKDEYDGFVNELSKSERIKLRDFETDIDQGIDAGASRYFEGCLPVEVLALRGQKALAFGPMRPVGLVNPHTGQRPYAVIQLRQDNLAGSLYNLVGFQTNLTFSEQKRVFRMIPGLQKANFVRLGQMHRNTFISSPTLLNPTLQLRNDSRYFFAGQITGIEGYVGSIATGLLAGINAARNLRNVPMVVLPKTTMIGALIHYITHADIQVFQPMKANFGLLPQPEEKLKGKRNRAKYYSTRAIEDLKAFIEYNHLNSPPPPVIHEE